MSLSKENKVIIDGQTYYGGLNQPPKFVKVNVDCWEKIFDYLALRDIVSMSQTCQRMRQIGGYYFRENFHGTECCLDADSGAVICTVDDLFKLERDDFLRFVDTVIDSDLEHSKHYSSLDLLGSLTTLILVDVELDANAIGNFEKSMLNNIETVHLSDCTIHDDFDVQLFASCPKLKCLEIKGLEYASDTAENDLLRYTYPMLEHFQHIDCHASASLITPFLERNSTIKSLRIESGYLLKIGLNTSTVQLDCLSVEVDFMFIGTIEMVNRLKTLHANGFYKKLHLKLKSSSDNESLINEMRSLGAIEVLSTWHFCANICYLTELKELHLHGLPGGGVDLESIARNLTKLERLLILGTVDHMIPFLRYSRALKWAVLSHRDADPLNLFQLNQVRQLCGSQRKVLIGVRQKQYLATKWKFKNVKYDLVEVTRIETIRERFEYQRF